MLCQTCGKIETNKLLLTLAELWTDWGRLVKYESLLYKNTLYVRRLVYDIDQQTQLFLPVTMVFLTVVMFIVSTGEDRD